MGCLWSSCCPDSSDQNGEADERTTLLADPVGSSCSVQRFSCDEASAPFCGSLPKKDEEQSVMNKILHEAATNVIDVAALGPHPFEQNEYLERKNYYKFKLGPYLNTPWHNPESRHKCVLSDIPNPEKEVSSLPISASDYCLIEKATLGVSKALSSLAVTHKEDLIVPFMIP